MTLTCSAIIITDTAGKDYVRAVESLKLFSSVIVVATAIHAREEEYARPPVSQVVLRPGVITDFAAIRNEAMKLATTEWCFFLDSDEVLDTPTQEAVNELQKLMSDETVSAIGVRRSDVFLEKKLSYGEAGRQELVRFLRGKSATWTGKAHERPIVQGHVKESSITLSHYSHESINLFIQDVSSYAKIIANEREVSRGVNLLQLLLFPPLKLAYDLIILGGVLDGWRGVTYSYCMALHSLLVRIYGYEKRLELVPQANTGGSR